NAVPTASAIDKQVKDLQDQVTKQQAMIDQLTAARQQKVREAEQAARQAEAATAQAGLQAFKVASGLRKDVADLSNQIEVAQAKLAPIKQDLALAQARQAAVAAAADAFQKQAQQIEEGWRGVQQQLVHQANLANAVVNGSTAGADVKTLDSIKEKA